MHIVHIASELAPIAKVGGLADVIHGLSKQLSKDGHTVEILLPKYDCIDYSQLKHLKVEKRELWSFENSYRYHNTIWSAEVDNLRILLLEPHHPSYYFSRGVIYGCQDDIDRFAYFSRAALEYLFKSEKQPDILHIHDWPTALIAPLYKEMYQPLGLQVGGIVLTIHNLEHQGRCSPFNLTRIGLRGESYLTPEKMQDPFSLGLINLLKGGIVYADAVTTVSPNYEKEIKTLEGGCGLHSLLVQHQKKLTGILNGIDETFWDPEKDSHLVKRYSTHQIDTKEKIEKVLKAKEENRRHIRTHFGMNQKDLPLCACVTRLVPQKGPALIKQALLRTLEKGGQFILLGSIPGPDIEKEFLSLKTFLAKNKNAAICLDKDESLAHLIYAACDMLIIPSLFEPCGLTQLIALRYGAVPIARTTGGLADTVFDVDTSSQSPSLRNGYTFDFPDETGVNWALDRALDCWSKDRKKWLTVLQQGMSQDFSWHHTAPQYLEVYKKASKRDLTARKRKLA